MYARLMSRQLGSLIDTVAAIQLRGYRIHDSLFCPVYISVLKFFPLAQRFHDRASVPSIQNRLPLSRP